MNVDIKTVDRKYSIIYCDPPWGYEGGKGIKGSCANHYSTMTMEELCAMGETVKRIAADDCALIMWVTYPKLKEIFESKLMKKWGFKYKTFFQHWNKINIPKWSRNPKIPDDQDEEMALRIGVGYYTRSNAECCLLAVKGSILKFKDPSTVVYNTIFEVPREHSRKPDVTRHDIVKLFGDIPRIELFARQGFPGWDYWGNQTDKFEAVKTTDEVAEVYKKQDECAKALLVKHGERMAKRKEKREAKKRKAETEKASDEAPEEKKQKTEE